jgi:catechol 2,3-dioxygenase-like lactoylglutathione lyase family enzyme
MNARTFPLTARERGRIAPTKLAHVVYLTHDLKQMLAWHQQVFEAEVVHAGPNIVFMTYDDEHHRTAIIEAPVAAKPPGTTGVHHIAYTFEDLRTLMATYKRLKALDIVPSWAINHGPTTSLYYKDPDGNQVEFQVENFPSVAETAQYFLSQDFTDNPIGVEYDPDDLLAKVEAGVSDVDLKKRPPGPISPIRG